VQHVSTRFLFVNLVAAVSMLGAAAGAFATPCGTDPDDDAAVVATDDLVLQQCECSPTVRHSTYIMCARKVAMAAAKAGSLPRRCVFTVKLCATGSTCGYPNASVPVCDLHTPTPTLIPTPTPTLPAQCVPPSLNVPPHTLHVHFKLTQGTTDCGGTNFNPPAAPPDAGGVDDGRGAGYPLGLGCLYLGPLPPSSIPFGSTSITDVVGVSANSITLGPSNGSDPASCTRGAGPLSHCIDGGTGHDGKGLCTTDAECKGKVGACALDANCYFGPPVPVPNSFFSACTINVFQTDLCGNVDLQSNTTNLTTLLSARAYLTGDPESPCPQCIASTCQGGENDGQPCTVVGSANTSPDCPPLTKQFLGALSIYFPALTTGNSSMSDNIGSFCPGQILDGAFGWPDARNLHVTGEPLTPTAGGQFHQTVASTFCVPSAHSDLLDMAAQLPSVGALSATGILDLSQVIPRLP
jgi:hypothetical protein